VTDSNLTSITVILDRSGSMAVIDADTVGGFNTFVDEQKKAAGEATMTLIRFDDQYGVDYLDKPVKDVPTLRSVEPRGWTAMYDAIGKGINELGEKLAKLSEEKRPGRVVFVIITDGQENASKEFKLDQIKSLIERQTKLYNWQFTFLGAGQDAVLSGTMMGISAGNSATFKGSNVRCAFMAASSNIGGYRSAAAGSSLASYSSDQRAQLVDDPAKPQAVSP
jgi:hypothetical protein